tara:strand:- start:9238 stop:11283 length:2046 start_codon:yes stop_codon:yes gene_type:complete
MAGLSMLRVVSNDELVKAEKEQLHREMEDRQQSELVLGLVAYVKSCWNPARIAKKPIENIMLRALRQRNGQYEADKLQQIKGQGGSQVYMMITEVKCRGAESWLRDILLDTGTPPWDLTPTPIPDLAPDQLEELKNLFAQKVIKDMQAKGVAPTVEEMAELEEVVSQDFRFAVLQEAQNRADKMKLKINDQFAQGGWADAFNEFITDMVTYPSAFVKGPVVRRQRILGYSKGQDGSTIVEGTERLGPEYERVNPFNVYPEPGITHINEGYIFEHHPMSRSQLADLIGVPGYDDEAIREVLKIGNGQSWINEDTKLQEEEQERKYYSYESPTETFDALEFWGKVSGKMLQDWGLSEEEVPDAAKEYDANVWVVGNYVIKAILNYDPLGEKPYVKTSFIKAPGAFWGKGIPEIIEDLQNVCNAAARSLVNNMGLASGPQVEVNLERIPPNEDITQLHPWKIWQVTNDPLGSSAPAVRFSQPDSRANELMGVYDRFSKLADDHSGVPSYVTGDLNVSGAGRTASGLSMLMGSAGKGIRQIVMYIDNDIVRPIVQRQFIYNMRYDEDESIKGDVEVLARGAINLATKETLNVRRVEFLNATANPIDIEIVGQDGRAALLREVAKGLQMPVDDIIPSREKGSQQAKGKAQMAAQQAQAAPAATQPDGTPKGGADGNVVSPQPTGAP